MGGGELRCNAQPPEANVKWFSVASPGPAGNFLFSPSRPPFYDAEGQYSARNDADTESLDAVFGLFTPLRLGNPPAAALRSVLIAAVGASVKDCSRSTSMHQGSGRSVQPAYYHVEC